MKKVEAVCSGYLLSEENFDYVIAYKQDYLSIAHALFQIKGKERILWMHGKLWRDKNANRLYLEWIQQFKKVICVSQSVKNELVKILPEVTEKVEVKQNILDVNKIQRMAKEIVEENIENKGLFLVTVGRLVSDKGQQMIPRISKSLKELGIRNTWLIVGDGDSKEKIKKEVLENAVEDSVFLVGEQNNPYKFINLADIFVNTSFHEGWGLTVQEAKLLQKPIVTPDIPVMHEQIEHLQNGYIVKDVSVDGYVRAISYLYNHPEVLEKFTLNLRIELENKN